VSSSLLPDTDSYKSSHPWQYPVTVNGMFSYLESRGGRYGHTVFFGLQPILQRLAKGFTDADIGEAAELFAAHGEPFPKEQLLDYWKRTATATHRNAHVPLKIRAVPEGTVVPTHNVLMTVESTNPETFWLASYFETQLMRVWYPITVATQSWTIKQIIKRYLDQTADNPEAELPFKLHDFGSRGVSSEESAGIGGCAHLVNFKGTDTVAALIYAREHYGERMAGFSIPAAEHSTITAWGKDREVDAYRNMLNKFAKPGALVAVVSDSYDLWNAIDNLWGAQLREQVINSGATVIIRPDSGNPPDVVCRALFALNERFGSTINTKGYKVLNNVRVIQGDGINEESIQEILRVATMQGFSATNIAFGMGGALLQQVNRDTQKFAYKASAVHTYDGKWVPICKDPVTDPGKKSKAGRLDLIRRGDKFETVVGDAVGSELVTVFENGKLLQPTTLGEVRLRAAGK
jgi:nicotinamide phosphoribosyltransferase